jgi:2-(1,2-epoxy-1,2-dihydrophenyl)acetyl-CoA isomerase
MTSQLVAIERPAQHAHVAILRMNRPDKMNAFDLAMTADMHAAIDELGRLFPEVRAVVLTGAGRGFCSGADVALVAANANGKKVPPVEGRYIIDIAPRLLRLPQPVIGAINGIATGAGLGIALACDMRIAAEQARFSSMFIKRSLVPDTGASFTLQRVLGPGLAAEMVLTGRIYDAAFALRHGLVNSVVPAEQLMPEALAIAAEIAANPPLAVRASKKLMAGYALNLEDVVHREMDANGPTEGTADRREAVQAFLEKRNPVYVGH